MHVVFDLKAKLKICVYARLVQETQILIETPFCMSSWSHKPQIIIETPFRMLSWFTKRRLLARLFFVR